MNNLLYCIKTGICKQNYKTVLKRLKGYYGQKPLKVVFIVTENQKWGYQSLYEQFANDKNFEPLVLISILKDVYKGKDKIRLNSEENYNFFKSRNMNVEYLYRDNKYTDLKQFKPDIVFYEQPWGIPKKYKPLSVSKYALCCHVPYSITDNPRVMKGMDIFYGTLWKHFIAHDCLIKELETAMSNGKHAFCVTGHPKLDAFNSDKKIGNKHYVIYAPHHSVRKSLLHFSTFDWSGNFMLEYAKAHPEVSWVFKPHPNLKSHFIKTGYMTKEEIDNYFAEWEKIAKVYTQGDYFDIFKASDAMITDCGSFLVEYFMTGKPLLHLISKDSAPHSELIRLVADNYYKIFNKESLNAYLDEIIIKHNDFLANVRAEQRKHIFKNNLNSAERILVCIKQALDS